MLIAILFAFAAGVCVGALVLHASGLPAKAKAEVAKLKAEATAILHHL